MKDLDLVSVIIPAYNAEKYIEETICSVLKQTHSYLELIAVDDGSTDNTANLLEKLCKKDSRIKFVKQKNKGVSSARNNGFSVSQGNYIAYLDADDVWEINHLESILLKFNSDKTLGLVHADAQEIDGYSQKMNKFYCGNEGLLLDNLLLGGMHWVTGTCGLVKKEVIKTVGGFDTELSNCADQEFFFRVASKYKIGRVQEVTWYYRMHANNMHSNIYLLEKDSLVAYKKADQYKLFKSPAFRRRCYSNMYFMLAGSFGETGKNKLKAARYLFKSILLYPSVILTFFSKKYSIF